MADITGAGNATAGGLTSGGVGDVARVEWYRAPLSTPLDLGAIGQTVADVSYIGTAWDPTLTFSVQVQVATTTDFASPVFDQTTTNVDGHGTDLTRTLATGLADATTYYVRARPKNAAGTYVGPWTVTRTFRVVTKAGYACMYTYENVGIELTPDRRATHYAYENVGVLVTLDDQGTEYVYENVGIEITLVDTAYEYVYESDVSANTPSPRIWYIEPTAGRAGDGIDVVGFGFGDLQTTFNGTLQMLVGGSWQNVAAVSWQTFPPTSDAYTDDRILDQISGEIDMQHQIIGIIVPNFAMPPGYPLRVVTDGA